MWSTESSPASAGFNACENEYCFQPFHVYEGLSGKLITAILRPAKTPTTREIMTVLKRVVKRLKEAWPKTKFLFRGDSHFEKPEVLDWLEAQGLFYLVGLAKNSVLLKRSAVTLAQAKRAFHRHGEKLRQYGSFYYAAKTWSPAEGGSDPAGRGVLPWRGSAVCGDQCMRRTQDRLREALLLARLRGIDDQGA